MAANRRKKPLYGAKKYSLIAQSCTLQDCDNEFYVSYAKEHSASPAKRFCLDHFTHKDEVKQTKQAKNRALLTSLGLM